MNWRMINRKHKQKIYGFAYRLLYLRRIETNILKKWLKFEIVKKIADIACGKGLISILCSNESCGCAQVCGLDLDRNNIRFANSITTSPNCEFQVGDAENFPYQGEAFDFVICNCSLEHFKNDEKALLEINRILKTRGKLFLTVDSFSSKDIDENVKALQKKKYRVINYYSLPEISMKLAKSGFLIVNNQHYIRSRFSKFICNFFIKMYAIWAEDIISMLAFPMIYPLIVLSDRFSTNDGGYYLAVLAEKCNSISSIYK